MSPEAAGELEDVAPVSPEGTDPVRARIEALAKAIRHLHNRGARGELAALRRMDEARAVEPALHKLLARGAPDAEFGARLRRDDIGRLALMTKVLALGMSIETLGRGHYDLGRMMADTKISERRVQTLMQARGPAFDDLILRLSRRLVREGALPYLDIGRLVLGQDEMVERTRRRVARGFWGARVGKEDQTAEQTAGGETE